MKIKKGLTLHNLQNPFFQFEKYRKTTKIIVISFCSYNQHLVMHQLYLFQAEISVPSSDSFPKVMTQGIEHGMVRMDRGQPVLLELFGHYANKFLHAGIVIGPIADYLQAVGQITVGIWKIRFQFQCSSVTLDGFSNIS